MRKNVIYAVQPDSGAELYLDFYYRSIGDGKYLFSCPYRRCLHLYFADGKSFRELREHRDWLKNRKLSLFVEGRLKKTLRRLYPQERQVPQMPEELMKGFLEQTIECVDAFSDALNYILHHYQVIVCEKEEFSQPCTSGSEKRLNCPMALVPAGTTCCQCPLRPVKSCPCTEKCTKSDRQ